MCKGATINIPLWMAYIRLQWVGHLCQIIFSLSNILIARACLMVHALAAMDVANGNAVVHAPIVHVCTVNALWSRKKFLAFEMSSLLRKTNFLIMQPRLLPAVRPNFLFQLKISEICFANICHF